MNALFASAGSQRWLQVVIATAPHLLDAALCCAGAIQQEETVHWKSPLQSEGFVEFRDEEALRRLEIESLPSRSLKEFWPRRGPVWDALGVTTTGRKILVEAKAHIAEAASPPSKASEISLAHIRRSLVEARSYFAPRATADWSGTLYQYSNRLAFHYLLSKLNNLPSCLVFLDFINASDVNGPESEAEWKGATRLMHALLGLPPDLTRFGVFHAHLDVRELLGVAHTE